MKTKIATSVTLVFSLTLEAQLNLNFQLLPQPAHLNPVPLRDNIPSVLVKTNLVAPINLSAPTKAVQTTKINNPPTGIVANKSTSILVNQTIKVPQLPASMKIVSVSTSDSNIEKEKIEAQISNLSTSKIPQEAKIKIDLTAQSFPAKPSELTFKKRNAPKEIAMPQIKLTAAAKAERRYDAKTDVPSTVKPLDAQQPLKISETAVNISPLIDITTDEYKMIQALLLLENSKRIETAMTIFVDLMQSKEFKLQATYHYAEIAYKLGLFNEFADKMSELGAQSKDGFFRMKSAESMIKNAKGISLNHVADTEKLLKEYKLDPSASDYYLYKRAQYYERNGELNTAKQSLSLINKKSELFTSAQVLLSNVLYRSGNLKQALDTITAALPELEKLPKNDKIRNLGFLTSARLHFQNEQYKKAYDAYLKVDKSSALWLEASQEQALAQVLFGDHVGAAGNMFSLHTDYFRKAYAPESYVLRAVSYLNLCQFGDAVSVVAELDRKYTKQLEQINRFNANDLQKQDFYSLIRMLFSNPSGAELNGLPRAFVMELARHPEFIGIQKKINSYESEAEQFVKIINGLAQKISEIRISRDLMTKTKNDLAEKQLNPDKVEFLSRQIMAAESEIALLSKGREKLEKMRGAALERTNMHKSKLKAEAHKVLKDHFAVLAKELNGIIEQKDVLAYDIYSGAGEHLRFQMAGGDTDNRVPAKELTPEEKKSYRWKFRGEVWEDEVGHYRSSLTNVCAKDDFASNNGGQ